MAGLQCLVKLAFEDKIIDDNNCEVKSSFSMSNYINIYIHIIQTPEANLSEGGGDPIVNAYNMSFWKGDYVLASRPILSISSR